jgi:hypothetical protein
MKEEKRRVKAALINPDDMVACFINPQFRRPDSNQNRFCWTVLELLECPPDSEVLTINWDFLTNYMRIYIYHPSFDIVPEREVVPMIQIKTRKVITDTTGAVVNTIVDLSAKDNHSFGESFASGPNYRTNPLL